MALFTKRQIIDSDYLFGRAETEVKLADKAPNRKIAETHQRLASAYFDRLFADEATPAPQRNPLEVQRENQLALTKLFCCWSSEQQEEGFEELVQALDAQAFE
jgi:hypothetical protein